METLNKCMAAHFPVQWKVVKCVATPGHRKALRKQVLAPMATGMKFFCGVQATGRGHLSRFSVVKGILEESGHEVLGYATGQELPPFARGISRFDLGPTFFIKNNKVDLLASGWHNLKIAPSLLKNVSQIAALLRQDNFDRAIVDFEPVSARAVCRARVPLTIFDNQTLTLLPLQQLPEVQTEIKAMRQFVKLYYGPALKCAERIITYSLAPIEAALPQQVVVPPCVRREILELDSRPGDHILFYSSIGPVPPGLIEFATKNPNVETRAYVATAPTEKLPDNITLPDRNNPSFLQDFATCRVYVANAGFESIAEAVALNKPFVAVPIQGQWEQQINGALLRHYQVGGTASEFSCEAFQKAYERTEAPSLEVQEWVATGRARLEEALLH